jgi:hypothetical protein
VEGFLSQEVKPMKKADLISSIFLLAVGLAFIFVIIPMQTAEGEEYGMSPSVVPTASMIIITGLAFVLLLQSIFSKRKGKDETVPFELRNWANIGLYSGLLFLCLGAIKYLGFILGGTFSIAAFMITMGGRNPFRVFLVSVPPPVIVYLVLRYGLRIPLP